MAKTASHVRLQLCQLLTLYTVTSTDFHVCYGQFTLTTQFNSTVVTVDDNAMTSLALRSHTAVHGPRVVCSWVEFRRRCE